MVIEDPFFVDFVTKVKGYDPLHYYFIDNVAGDNETGVIDKIDKPFKTWSGIHASIEAGDMIVYRNGIHDNQINCSYPSLHGTEQNPIIVMAYPNETPIIDRLAAGIYLKDCSHITLDGIGCRNTTTKLGRGVAITGSSNINVLNIDSGWSANGLFAMQDLHDIHIENCIFHDTDFAGTHGVYLGSRDLPNSNITFKNNLIFNCGMTGFQHNGRVTNLVVENNVIHSCNMAALSLVMGVSDSVFRNNLCYNNNQGVVIYNYISTATDTGILPYDQINNHFINNTFWTGRYRHTTGDHAVEGPDYFASVHFNDSIKDPYSGEQLTEYIRSFDNNIFRNNLFVSSAGPVFRFDQQDFLDTTIIENNVIYRYGDHRYAGIDGILNYGGGYYDNHDFDYLQNFSDLITGNIYAWPEFRDVSIDYATIPESFNFKLLEISPAIDFGLSLGAPTLDLIGTARLAQPDAGCYEYFGDINSCEGVVCGNVCVGKDLWSQKCVNGLCVADQLIESNSLSCGYDPCEGVVCGNVCVSKDLWSQKCVNGLCVPYQLIESNSKLCGYDPCEGVVCPNVCVGPNLWSQSCDTNTGKCILNQLIQQDSITCKIPEQTPSDETTTQTYLIIGGLGVVALAILILAKKR